MHILAISHSVISLLTLLAGLAAWRLTSSRSVLFLSFFGSACLLFSAHFVQTGQEVQLTYFIPFMVFALFAGRAIGLGYRSRKEEILRSPALFLGAAALLSLGTAVVTFVNA